MGKEKERYGLAKVPKDVILKVQQDEIMQLKNKNHEIVEKAKEREAQWKAYTEELLNTIRVLQKEENDEEKKAIRREVRALKKKDEDYQLLLAEVNKLKQRNEVLKDQVSDLMNELEGKPIDELSLSRKELSKRFNKLKNRRKIMDALGFPYNEAMPIAFNAINFLEWVRSNRLWSALYTAMFQLK